MTKSEIINKLLIVYNVGEQGYNRVDRKFLEDLTKKDLLIYLNNLATAERPKGAKEGSERRRDGIERDTDRLIKGAKTTLYGLLQCRPFCNCSKKEKDLYSAWCLRIQETWEMIKEY